MFDKLTFYVLAVLSLVFSACDLKNNDEDDSTYRKKIARETDSKGRSLTHQQFDGSQAESNEDLRAELYELQGSWDRLMDSGLGGEALLEAQRELALEAVGRLGPSTKFSAFLDHLRRRGAEDLWREMISDGVRGLFAGEEAEQAREWALVYAEDRTTREPLMFLAGEEFSGPGFKPYFERVDAEGCHNSQASLLAGYCTAIARSNPALALRTYRELARPFKIDYTGMRYLIAAFPPETDFVDIAVNEIEEDKWTLAKANRAELLRNWSGQSPEGAAQYVISNVKSGKVHAD